MLTFEDNMRSPGKGDWHIAISSVPQAGAGERE